MTEKKKAGRKAKTLTSEQVIELRALSQYLTQEQIADYFEISERTLHNIFDREPHIYAAYKKGAINAIARSASTLTKMAWGYKEYDENGDVIAVHQPDRAALMFHLKCRGGWRETAELNQDSESPPLNVTFSVSKPVGEIEVTRGKARA